EDVVEDPHPAQHRRRSRRIRRDRQNASVPEQSAARAAWGKRYTPKAAAINLGNSVMLGQTLVEEGVVGPDQIAHAAILAQDAVHEELGLLTKRLTKVVVEVRVEAHVGVDR